MCKTTVKLWHLKNDGRKLFAGIIEAGSPARQIAPFSAITFPRRRINADHHADPARETVQCPINCSDTRIGDVVLGADKA